MTISPRVLVIEDDEDSIVLLSDLFRSLGWFVHCETTGQAGLEALAQGSFDMLILDVMLPDMDGFEIARAIRCGEEPGEHLPIIMLTARGEIRDQVVGLESGADDYVIKPFRPREFVARIQAHLRSKQIEDHLRIEAQQWLTVFESIRDGAFIVDEGGRVLKANAGFCELTHCSPQDLRDRPLSWLGLTTPKVEAGWLAQLEGRASRSVAASQDVQVYLPNGQRIWVHASFTPLPVSDSDGHDSSMGLGIWRDITEQREMADKLRRQNRHLVALNAVAAAVSSSLDLYEMLGNALDRLLDVLALSMGQIHLWDEAAQVLALATQRGVPEEYARQMKTMALGESLTGKVAQTGESMVFSHGAAQDPRVSLDATSESGVEALVIVPLRVRERLLGTLSVGSFQPHVFSGRDLDLLSAVADQLGVAIENAQLFHDTTRQVRELQALTDASCIISSELDQDRLLEALYEQITRTAVADYYGIALYDEATNVISVEISADEGVRYPKRQYVLDKGLLQQVVHGRQPLRFDDLREESDGLDIEIVSAGSGKHDRSWLGVPMIYHDKVVGAIAVGSYQQGVFDEGHQQMLTSIANQAAVAIENARLYQQTDARLHRRVAELTALNEIGRTVSSILDLDQILAVTMQHIKDGSQVEAGSLVLVDEVTKELVFRVVLQEEEVDGLVGLRLPAGTGVVGYCIEHNEPALVPDVRLEPRFYPGIDKLSGLETVSLLCVPLDTPSGVLGAIELVNKIDGTFDQNDLNLLISMSAFVAIALENARLYAAVRDHALLLEKEVADRTRELRTILNSVADGLVVTAADDRVVMVNAVARQWLNLREAPDLRGETVGILWRAIQGLARGSDSENTVEIGLPLAQQKGGQACYEWFHCTADCPVRQLAEECVACWLEPGTQCRQLHPDGFAGDMADYCLACEFYHRQKKFTLQAHSAQMQDDEGQIIGEVTVLRDITRLKELDRLKSQFVSNVSHELKTPLGNIKMYLALLEQGKPEKRERYKVVLRQEVEHLEDLITDLLDLSRLETGTVRANKEALLLNEVVERVQLSLHPRAEEHKIALGCATFPDLPPTFADGDQIQQVVTNLLSNAINYTPAGGQVCVSTGVWHLNQEGWQVSGEVPPPGRLNVEPPGARWAVLCVADTGKGISADDLPRIFDRFFRGQAEHSEVPGTGLGLSIVKEILELHDGHVYVESQVGEGSTFVVLLPVLD
jgi:NtrC-family two-component system sensor histidine kinase KinB